MSTVDVTSNHASYAIPRVIIIIIIIIRSGEPEYGCAGEREPL